MRTLLDPDSNKLKIFVAVTAACGPGWIFNDVEEFLSSVLGVMVALCGFAGKHHCEDN